MMTTLAAVGGCQRAWMGRKRIKGRESKEIQSKRGEGGKGGKTWSLGGSWIAGQSRNRKDNG